MSWNQTDLDALEKAIASGVSIVKYSDKTVQYRSMAEMLQARDLIRQALGLTKKGGQRFFTNFDKGLGS